MKKAWYMELPLQHLHDQLSKPQLLKLRRFYMQQLELSQALLEAKPLGICRITTSGRNPTLHIHRGEEDLNDYIPSKNDSKEMSS